MATPTGAGRFNGREPHAVVGGNDAAHRGDRYPVCLAISWARLRGNQRVIDNPPAVSHPEARIQFHAPFDFFQGKMRCGSGDSASHDACSLLFISFLYYTTWNASWYQRGITLSPTEPTGRWCKSSIEKISMLQSNPH